MQLLFTANWSDDQYKLTKHNYNKNRIVVLQSSLLPEWRKVSMTSDEEIIRDEVLLPAN